MSLRQDRAPRHAAPKDAEPVLDREALKKVLSEAEADRVNAHRELRDHNGAVAQFRGDWIEERARLKTAVNEARGSLNGVDRRKAGMSKAAWQKERGPLEKAVKAAEQRLAKATTDAQSRAQDFNAKAEPITDRVQEVEADWRTQERLAKALKIDLGAYWSPDKPLPAPEAAEEV